MGQQCHPCQAIQKQSFDFPTIKNIEILEEYRSLKQKNTLNSQLKTVKLQNGHYFLGKLDINNKKQGYGQLTTGAFLYAGDFKNDLPHGKGILVTQNNQYYIGQFINGQINGQGKQSKQHFSFKGLYKQGKRVKGQLIHPKFIYNGQFQNSLFHGYGTIQYIYNQIVDQQRKDKNSIKYVGSFKNGKFHGKGKLWLKQNTSYQGNFQNGLYHGYGEYKYQNGNQYHGNYQKGKKHGYGRLYINEVQFAGQWKEGQRSGKAIISKQKNAVFGEWKQNQLIENH